MIKIGTDICSVNRIAAVYQRQRERFLRRILCPSEQALAVEMAEPRLFSFLSGRFAGKEAIVKALGTGIGQVSWVEVSILPLASGQPSIQLRGEAARIAAQLGLLHWQISLSHDGGFALAFVIAHGETDSVPPAVLSGSPVCVPSTTI